MPLMSSGFSLLLPPHSKITRPGNYIYSGVTKLHFFSYHVGVQIPLSANVNRSDRGKRIIISKGKIKGLR